MPANETVEKPSRVLNCAFGLFDRDQKNLASERNISSACFSSEALFMSYAPGEMMAKDKTYDDAQMVMIPVALERQLMPGTLEFAIHELVQRRMDPSIFDRIYRNDETGCPADDPKILLKVILLASARGLVVLSW
jgi:hypothetical protein